MTEKRKRRSRESIREAIANTATAIIKERGFSGLTVTAITQNSQIEPCQFYNRYDDLNEFIDEYVKDFDYWFSDVVLSQNDKGENNEQYTNIIINLLNSLSNNKVMQQLLKWELSTNNETSKRTSQLRELHTLPLCQKYERVFAYTNVDIVAISSLIIGGIYYLVLHGELSSFAGIQIETEEGRLRISNAITFLSDMMFKSLTQKNERIELISKMREDNIPTERISYYTGVPEDIIEHLFNNK